MFNNKADKANGIKKSEVVALIFMMKTFGLPNIKKQAKSKSFPQRFAFNLSAFTPSSLVLYINRRGLHLQNFLHGEQTFWANANVVFVE